MPSLACLVFPGGRRVPRVHSIREETEEKQDNKYSEFPEEKHWNDCKLHMSEICDEELVPNELLFARNNTEAKCAWLRSQIIGSQLEISTPFGTRKITYADYTASGRCVKVVEEFLAKHVMARYGNTHTEDSYVGSVTSRLVSESTRYIKQCTGASEDDALLFCGSGTTAAIKRLQEVMGLTVPGMLRDTVLQHVDKQWVVFVGPYEHHSNLLSWRQSLAEVVQVPLDDQGMVDITFLKMALRDPKYADRPKIGSFSACSNVSGILTDTRKLALLLHQHEAFACFDFASSGPYVEIDMRSDEPDGYDAVFLSPHKFVGGPGTPGILIMNKRLYLLQQRAPSTAGGGVVDFVNGFSEEDTIYLEDVEHREDAGTPQILQRIKAALAFWIKDEMSTELIEAREHYFITTALKRLSSNPNIMILGNAEVKRAAICSFLIQVTEVEDMKWRQKILQARFVVKLLSDLFGIQARGGCSCAGPYGHALLNVDRDTSLKFRDAIEKGFDGISLGWCRVSFAYFLSPEEFEYIVSAIEFIAWHGRHFVACYDFDWKTGNWTFNQPQLQKFLQHGRQPAKGSQLVGLPYKRYFEEVTALAKTLSKSNYQKQRHVPEAVNPELINFKL